MDMETDMLSREELVELRKLLEIEKIRKKKNLYSHYVDGLEHELFAGLYAEDALAEWGPFGTWRGRNTIYEKISENVGGRPLFNWLHITSNLWIELTGATTATSRCYLHDVLTDPNPDPAIPPLGFGIYEEDWVKIDGDWKIQHHRIHFLYPMREPLPGFPTKMVAS